MTDNMITFPVKEIRFKEDELMGVNTHLMKDYIKNKVDEVLGNYKGIGMLTRIDNFTNHEIVYRWYA